MWIMSREMSTKEFSELSKGHWTVENALHYVLDTAFNEDRNTGHKDHATENLFLLHKIVFNQIHLDPITKNKTKKEAM